MGAFRTCLDMSYVIEEKLCCSRLRILCAVMQFAFLFSAGRLELLLQEGNFSIFFIKLQSVNVSWYQQARQVSIKSIS